MKKSIKNLSIFAYLTLLIVLIIGVRYAYIQIINAEHYQEKTAEQRVKRIENKPYTIDIFVGTIYFAPILSATTKTKAHIALVANHQSGFDTFFFISFKEIAS
mgnify:CR=1 FL=1